MKDHTTKVLTLLSVMAGMISFVCVKAIACPIPVYRYALEYWETDPYIIDLFYDHSDSEQEKIVDFLLEASETKTNLEVRKMQLSEKTSVGSNFIPAGQPYMVLRYPRVSGINKVVWSGTLSRENIGLLLNSKARTTIADKLVSDATAVWVLLESGDRRKDREALEMLEKQLRRLEQTLVLPDRDLWWAGNDKHPVIKFEIVRISRHDPEELPIVNMLLNSEEDLSEFDSEPIVFPIYGRGLALYAIVGKGINEWTIKEAAEFITGPCSCQAKLLNPGIDLVFTMDWDNNIEKLTNLNIANPLSGMGDFTSRAEEVKRLLDAATAKRLGTGSNATVNQTTEPEKVVYLDIFGGSKKAAQSSSNKDAQTIKENVEPEAPEPEDKILADEDETEVVLVDKSREIPIFMAEKGPAAVFDTYQKNKGYNPVLIILLSGAALIVLIGAVLLKFRM